MARPKNTRATKWLRWSDSWHRTRKEAIASAKHSKYITVIEHQPNAKTQWGQYRLDKWVVLNFYPKIYRGRETTAHPFRTKSDALKVKKYRPNDDLVKIRDGRWIWLGKRVTHARRKKGGKKKKR